MAQEWHSPAAVRKRLERLGRTPLESWHRQIDLEGLVLSEAAVLIPIVERDGCLEVLFTERSEDLPTHSGEISFPGGGREGSDDSLVETALRETHEEVGLHPSEVDVYGALTRIPTITGFEVTAFVGEFSIDSELIIEPAEIHLVFRAPIAELADPAIHRVEEREFSGEVFPVHFYDYRGHIIWGATGFLLHQFLEYLR